jgi:signal-transduction protein with cAMP-binding, CBS, and nucleotidyltransferase domain
VSDHLLAALSHVPTFARLDEDGLATLRDAMSVAKFEDLELVVEQGVESDAFYAITAGKAEVCDPTQT